MNILYRYIIKNVLAASGIVMLVVTGIIFFVTLLNEIRAVGVGDYGFIQAVFHVVLCLPHLLYQFFPMLVLVGGMVGLGLLAASQELMVMRASGISLLNVLQAMFVSAVILICFAVIMGEIIAPQANFFANKRKLTEQNKGQAVATASGVWIHEGDNFLHIDKIVDSKHLLGITRYQFDSKHHLLAAYFANSIEFDQGQWHLHNLLKTIFLRDKTSSQFQAEGVWDLSLNPNLLNMGIVEPQEMSLLRLKQYSHHLLHNRLEATAFQFEFWKRFFQPLTTMLMLFLCIPFIFFVQSRQTTMGWRVLVGVLVGFLLFVLNEFLSQICVVFQLYPFIAAMLPTLLIAMVFCGMVYKLQA